MNAQHCFTSDVPVGAGQWKLEQQRQTLRNSEGGAGTVLTSAILLQHKGEIKVGVNYRLHSHVLF